jgi:hypothetical protein
MLVIAAVVVLHACVPPKKGSGKDMPSLKETYDYKDTRPFGTYVAHRLLKAMYPTANVKALKETIEDARRNSYDTGAVYITIAESFFTSEEDVTALKNYVRAGNDMFIAASEFDNNLLDEINCSVNSSSGMQMLLDVPMAPTSVKLNQVHYGDSSAYSYFYRPFANFFRALPKGESVVLGYNDKGSPNFVVIFIGSGRLFLHCEPRAFSNYFLLQKNNYQYFKQAMTFTKRSPEKVTWNDFYPDIHRSRSNKDDDNKGSLFDGLKGGLLVAFWMLLALIVLYIIDGTKRRQRIIPIRKPNENTTVTFAETVGLLYLQKKDNKNIAEKMIAYFNEFVRNQYFLNTNHPTSEFITTLSRKSGVPQDMVDALYRAIAHAQRNNVIDDYQLLSLNQQIQNFYKYRN